MVAYLYQEKNFANLLKLGKIVCLQAPASVLIERTAHVTHRPLLNLNDLEQQDTHTKHSQRSAQLEKLLAGRKATYARAEYQIDTNNETVETVVTRIRTALKL